MPSDKESPNIQELLVIHFFRPSDRTPWWMRLGWRPVFSHVTVQWQGLIHDLPYGGVGKWYMADEFLDDKPADVSVPLPYRLGPVDQKDAVLWIANRYDGRRVERLRVVLWRFGIRRRKPRSCGTLASLWISLLTDYTVDAVTPDELFRQLLGHAIRERNRGKPASAE